jgi:hypothetical protein
VIYLRLVAMPIGGLLLMLNVGWPVKDDRQTCTNSTAGGGFCTNRLLVMTVIDRSATAMRPQFAIELMLKEWSKHSDYVSSCY